MRPRPARSFLLAFTVAGAAAQNPFTIYNQTQRLPTGCVDGYSPGTDTVLYTVPYSYAQVLSIIGSFKNLTWSGNPDNTVTLNGTDNTVGTSRSYDTGGAHVIETLTLYNKPAAGPYEEAHSLAPITIPTLNLSLYSDYDANFATPTCGGAATIFNETVNFCATNATLAAGVLHMLHLADVSTVAKFLGGRNFTTCASLTNSTSPTNATSTKSAAPGAGSSVFGSLGNGTSNVGMPKPTSSPTSPASPAAFTAGADALFDNLFLAGLMVLLAIVMV